METASEKDSQTASAGPSPDSSPESQRDVTRGILALFDQAFVSLTNFVTFVLVAQFCSRSDLNLYVLAWSIFNVFRVIQERGLAAPYFVLAHEKGRDPASFTGSSLIHQLLFAVLVTLLIAIMALFFGFRETPVGMASGLVVLLAAAPCILLRDHIRAISCAHFRYGFANMLSATAMLIQIALILFAYWMNQLDVRIVFAAMGIGSLIPCVVWYFMRPIAVRFEGSSIVPNWKSTYAFSKWLVAARIFPSLAMGVLPWIVLWAIDENAAGTLGGCITLANISNMFVFGANYFFLPRAVKALQDHGQRAMCNVLVQTVIVFSSVLTLLCVVYLFSGDWLLVLAFGETFHGYAVLTSLIGLSYLIVSYSTIAGNGMTALGSPEGLFWGELAFGIVAVVAGLVLSFQFGLIGTAMALCIASLLATIIETRYLLRLLD